MNYLKFTRGYSHLASGEHLKDVLDINVQENLWVLSMFIPYVIPSRNLGTSFSRDKKLRTADYAGSGLRGDSYCPELMVQMVHLLVHSGSASFMQYKSPIVRRPSETGF